MKLRIVSLALVAALVGTFVVGTANASAKQQAGARALVDLIVGEELVDIDDSVFQVGLVNVNRSLNNLRALNNVLNNSPILSNNDIDVTVGDITVLQDFLNENDIDVTIEDILEDIDVDVEDIVAIVIVNLEDVLILV